ncbi:Zinc finger A20 and AN1 domain-containing stress-associated protein 5 [Morella rubra]|uniref:Zinc finger A20 and AN1 domain-containing stress-associated protein 5 n=1 Tax=Morella rubra TaxID=262757 RepID=A0A6A1WHW8_9ROSI|nr:Zinc finger A20 and AN1 domain-containing stress-associated protein 5 [Morella rubra]
MAQKTEKEETEFKVAETITLCVNNCGVMGNPATNNMCQKCFNATTSMCHLQLLPRPPSRHQQRRRFLLRLRLTDCL